MVGPPAFDDVSPLEGFKSVDSVVVVNPLDPGLRE